MGFKTNIFINCPFDDEFKDNLLKPMLFAVIKVGFTPRLASEVSDSGEARLEKITSIMKQCKYSIHDLSLVKSDDADEYARMNMPFELGIDYGLRKSGVSPLNSKKFLILEATQYDYQKAASDLNGFDLKVHANNTEKILDCLYRWFSETLKIHKQDPPQKTFLDFAVFNADLFEEKKKQYGSDKLAKNYAERITIPEYILEIQERIKK
jgi:hypothetical protein